MSDKTKILHLTPHLNGGLGKVLLLQAECSQINHHICLIEKKISDYHFLNAEITSNIFNLSNSTDDLFSAYDVVQVEYWNHPLIYELFLNGTLDNVNCLVGCAHIQGDRAPQLISKSAIKYVDKMLVTGQWLKKSLSDDELSKKIEFLKYPIDIKKFSKPNHLNLQERKIRLTACYVGTVSYSKLSREFFNIIEACSSYLDFIIVGDPDDEILADPRARRGNLSFIGKTDDVTPYLSNSDLFFYPLRKGHYGTGELALIEAMSFSLPIVAFDNESESSLIINNQTGILCSTFSEFISALSSLAANKSLRERLGFKARKHIESNYSYEAFETFAKSFYENIHCINFRNKYSVFMEDQIQPLSVGAKCFIQSLEGIDDTCHHVMQSMIRVMNNSDSYDDRRAIIAFFRNYPEYRYKSKGGFFHYLYCFPGDQSLKMLSDYASSFHE
jgi:glycosyltransferase involved in cell wall biosynthesis